MASTEIQSVSRAASTRSDRRERPEVRTRLGAKVVGLARASLWGDVVGLTMLLGCTAAVYWPALIGVGTYARSDTFTFFYPVFAALHQSLREGQLPLWTPHIFGGFPLFAEGQIGALYPPNVLAVLLFPSPVDGFLALRVFHVAVAALGAYALGRSLGVSAVGACVVGFVFGFGSFVVGQQHHANLVAAAVWLPLVLACVELALRRAGWISQVYLAVAALLLGLQAMASHIQPVMLSGALVLAYIAFRQTATLLAPRFSAASRRARAAHVARSLGLGIWAALLVPLLGAFVAAVQLLPLYELSGESWRASGWSYQDAIEYSFPPFNFATLLLPFLFRSPDGDQWSLWQAWEVVLYVGVVPLVLACVAVVGARTWSVAFFTVAAVVSALVSLGGYAPFGLYEHLWTVPGMQLQRAPARFTFVTVLALGVLAGHGADRVVRAGSQVDGRGRRSLPVLQLSVVVLLIGLVTQVVSWRTWLSTDRPEALRVIVERYLSLARDPLQPLSPLSVHAALEAALDVSNPKTLVPMALLGVFAILLGFWREAPRLRRVWTGTLVLLVAVDLMAFAVDFHPLVPADDLGRLGGVGDFLRAHGDGRRVLTFAGLDTLQPNQLLPARVPEAAGYSPLQLDRHRWFLAAVQTVDMVALDLLNVGFVVEPADPPALPSYQQVAYHPRRPLHLSGASTSNGRLVLEIANEIATDLRIVAALSEGMAIADGDVVGEWVLTDTLGVRRTLPVRAGREIADWTVGEFAVRTAHRPVQVATVLSVRDFDGADAQARTLSYASLRLPSRAVIARMEYRHTHPLGQTAIYGAALLDGETGGLAQLDRAVRNHVVYRDHDAVVYENRRAFPRAFVVPEAVSMADGPTALERLTKGPFDPTRQVLIERLPDVPSTQARRGSTMTSAEIIEDRSSQVDLRVRAPEGGYLVLADAYYPGWRALVDGREVEILRANYLFRAVPVSDGDHDVVFWFDPPSVRLGLTMSAAGLSVVALLFTVGALGAGWARWSARRDHMV